MGKSRVNNYERQYQLGKDVASLNIVDGRLIMSFCGIEINKNSYGVKFNLVFNSDLRAYTNLDIISTFFTHSANNCIAPYSKNESYIVSQEDAYVFVDGDTYLHKFIYYKTKNSVKYYYDEFGSGLILKVENSSYVIEDEQKNQYFYNSYGKITAIKAGINNNIYKVFTYNEEGRLESIYDNRKANKKIRFVYDGVRLSEIRYNNYTIKFEYGFYGISKITKHKGKSFKKLYSFEYNDNYQVCCIIDYSSKESLSFEYTLNKITKVTKSVIKVKKQKQESLNYLNDTIQCGEDNYCGITYDADTVIEHQLIDSEEITYNESTTSIVNSRGVNLVHYFNTDKELINVLRKESGNKYYTSQKIFGFDMLDVEYNPDGTKKTDLRINDSGYLSLHGGLDKVSPTDFMITLFNERINDFYGGKSPFYKAVSMMRLSDCANRDVKVKIKYTYKENENSSTIKTEESIEVRLQKTSHDVWQMVNIPLYFSNPEIILVSMDFEFSGMKDSMIDIAYLYLCKSDLNFYRALNGNTFLKYDKIKYRKMEESALTEVNVTKDFYMSKMDMQKSYLNCYKAMINQEDNYDLILCDGKKRIEVRYVYLMVGNIAYDFYADTFGLTTISFINSNMEGKDKYRHIREAMAFSKLSNDEIIFDYITMQDVNDEFYPHVSSNILNSTKTYNEYGMLVEEKDTQLNSRKYEYDSYGNLVKETVKAYNEEDVVITYEYDSVNPSVKEYLVKKNSTNETILITYDTVEEVVVRQQINNEIKEYKYDKFYDIIKQVHIIDANNNMIKGINSFEYDSFGNICAYYDKNNIEHILNYNEKNFLKEVISNDTLKEDYNYNLNVGQVNTTGVVIRNADVIQKNVYINGASTYYVNEEYYNKYGNIVVKKNNNDAIIFSYDNFNEVTEIYDPYTMYTHKIQKDPTYGFVTYKVYDLRNNLIFEKEYINNDIVEYDLNDNCIRTTANEYGNDNDNYTLIKTVDKDSSFSSNQKDFTYEITYNRYNLVDKLEAKLDNGNVDFCKEFEYNTNKDKVVTINQSTEFSIIIDNYEYDNFGNISSISEDNEVVYGDSIWTIHENATYKYDNQNRLIEENNSIFGNIEYQYDNKNNLIKVREKDGIVLNNLRYIEGRLIYTRNDGNISYDKYGNAIRYNNCEISYDSRNKVSKITKTVDGVTITEQYYYNYQGVRYKKVSKKNNVTLTTEYVLDGNRILKEIVKDSNGNVVREFKYFYNAQGVCGIRYNGVNYTLIRDLLGNVRKIIRGHDVICAYWYDAWGNQSVNYIETPAGSDDMVVAEYNPFRYRGYYFDKETNLFLVSSRYYSPELCHWISPDDIEYLDPESVNGLNLYCYCFNNPIMYKDSTGHFPVAIDAMTTFFEGSIELYSFILKYSLKTMEKAPKISIKVAKKMARKGGHLQSARQIINKPQSLINSTKNTIDDLANFSKKLGKVLLVADIAWSLGENILSGDESWLTDSLIDIGISVGLYFLPGGFLVSLGASILLSIFDDEIEEFKDDFHDGWNKFWSFDWI